MNIVIIEDEDFTANDLADTLLKTEPEAKIIAILSSVKSAIEYFSTHEEPDLIFSDIQLGDGLSFEIFREIKIEVPVVFCTAFDEYALNAFKANGIDYVLKPFSEKDIHEALRKFKTISHKVKVEDEHYNTLVESLINRTTPKMMSILVHFKDRILPIRIENIALFYIENEIVYLITLDNRKYSVNKTLDELTQLCGNNFFRTNRQYLINRKSIVDASQYFNRKLSVNVSVPVVDKVTVSKTKATQFLIWLEQTE